MLSISRREHPAWKHLERVGTGFCQRQRRHGAALWKRQQLQRNLYAALRRGGLLWEANGGSALAAWNLSGQFAETYGVSNGTIQLGAFAGSNPLTQLSAYSGAGTKTYQVGALDTNTTFAGAILDAAAPSAAPPPARFTWTSSAAC